MLTTSPPSPPVIEVANPDLLLCRLPNQCLSRNMHTAPFRNPSWAKARKHAGHLYACRNLPITSVFTPQLSAAGYVHCQCTQSTSFGTICCEKKHSRRARDRMLIAVSAEPAGEVPAASVCIPRLQGERPCTSTVHVTEHAP